jgi:putative tricarboxylic transport membrane protein
MTSNGVDGRKAFLAGALARKDVIAGAMFIAIALAGLWISRNYPVGTAVRMGTGYVPRLLLWLLLLLGGVILIHGARHAPEPREAQEGGTAALRGLVFVTASLVVFGLTIERLGIVVSILLLIGIGALAARDLRVVETIAAAALLIVLSWAIFIVGLGLTIPVWPEW